MPWAPQPGTHWGKPGTWHPLPCCCWKACRPAFPLPPLKLLVVLGGTGTSCLATPASPTSACDGENILDRNRDTELGYHAKIQQPSHQPLEQTTYGQRNWRQPQTLCKTETHKQEHDSFQTTTNKVRWVQVSLVETLLHGWVLRVKMHTQKACKNELKLIDSKALLATSSSKFKTCQSCKSMMSSFHNPLNKSSFSSNLGFRCKNTRPKVSSRRIRAKSYHQCKYTSD